VTGVVGALALAGAVIISLVAFHGDHRTPPVAGPTKTVYTNSTSPQHQSAPSEAGKSSPSPVRPAPQPALSVQPVGCDLGTTGLSCTVTLTGAGATVHWTATGTDPLSLSSSSGSLEPGETDTVTITFHPPAPRVTGSASVTFTGAGHAHTVRVTWESEPDPDPSSS
jgi:hypothetical protein